MHAMATAEDNHRRRPVRRALVRSEDGLHWTPWRPFAGEIRESLFSTSHTSKKSPCTQISLLQSATHGRGRDSRQWPRQHCCRSMGRAACLMICTWSKGQTLSLGMSQAGVKTSCIFARQGKCKDPNLPHCFTLSISIRPQLEQHTNATQTPYPVTATEPTSQRVAHSNLSRRCHCNC